MRWEDIDYRLLLLGMRELFFVDGEVVAKYLSACLAPLSLNIKVENAQFVLIYSVSGDIRGKWDGEMSPWCLLLIHPISMGSSHARAANSQYKQQRLGMTETICNLHFIEFPGLSITYGKFYSEMIIFDEKALKERYPILNSDLK